MRQVGGMRFGIQPLLNQDILSGDRGQVMEQDGGVKFLANGLWRLATELFELEAALEMAEGFLDAPAFLIERRQGRGRPLRFIQQRGGQHFDLAALERHAHQAEPKRLQG